MSAGKSEFKHKTVGASKLAPLPCSCVKEDHALLLREGLLLEAGKAKVDRGPTNFPKSELPKVCSKTVTPSTETVRVVAVEVLTVVLFREKASARTNFSASPSAQLRLRLTAVRPGLTAIALPSQLQGKDCERTLDS